MFRKVGDIMICTRPLRAQELNVQHPTVLARSTIWDSYQRGLEKRTQRYVLRLIS